MFTRILVPLDGSDRAEQAIPVAARMARASGGTVILVHAAPIHGGYQAEHKHPAEMDSENVIEEGKASTSNYLDTASRMAELVGVKTETRVEYGDVALSILAALEPPGVDLIVMCSHGHTGFKRWAASHRRSPRIARCRSSFYTKAVQHSQHNRCMRW